MTIVSVKTRLVCVCVCVCVCTYVCMYVRTYVYYALGIVSGDPLLSYCGHLKYLCPLYIIRSSVRLNSV